MRIVTLAFVCLWLNVQIETSSARIFHNQVNMGIVDVNTAGTGPKYTREDELKEMKS